MPTATLEPKTDAVSFDERLARLERRFERRVAELERIIAEKDAEHARIVAEKDAEHARVVAEKDREIFALRKENQELKTRVAELEAKLKENSGTSDRPPSSDPPWNKRATRARKRARRKRGAQPGHKGVTRELLPTEKCDSVVPVFAKECQGCGASLPERATADAAPPLRHQVTEVPPTKPHVTEYQVHATRCKCGEVTCGRLPSEVAGSSFGPGLQARLALLTGRYRLSRREAVSAVKDLFGVEISLGSVSALEQATSEALEAPYDEALETVRKARVANADETGWRMGPKRMWLWIAVTARLAVFWIDPRRSGAAFRRFLGRFAGYLVTDRWGAYLLHPKDLRQLCWAHLKRDFEKLVLRGGEAAKLGNAALAEIKRIFALWHRFKRREITRAQLQQRMGPIQERLFSLLCDGLENSHPKARGLCAKLLPLYRCLWVFLRVPGVEPTNNDGERDLRKAVLWRKGSFGCQSTGGCLYASRILTACACLRKQQRDVLSFFESAIRAHRIGRKAPSLLPR